MEPPTHPLGGQFIWWAWPISLGWWSKAKMGVPTSWPRNLRTAPNIIKFYSCILCFVPYWSTTAMYWNRNDLIGITARHLHSVLAILNFEHDLLWRSATQWGHGRSLMNLYQNAFSAGTFRFSFRSTRRYPKYMAAAPGWSLPRFPLSFFAAGGRT